MLKFLTPRKSETVVKHSKEFFHMTIVGRSGCGKTQYLLDILNGELFKKFNAIFLICPTFSKNQTYLDFSSDEKFYVIPDEIEKLEESIVLARREESKYYRSLVIFDDVIGTGVLNSRTSKYVNLLIGGRHHGISTITISQQLTSISKAAKEKKMREKIENEMKNESSLPSLSRVPKILLFGLPLLGGYLVYKWIFKKSSPSASKMVEPQEIDPPVLGSEKIEKKKVVKEAKPEPKKFETLG